MDGWSLLGAVLIVLAGAFVLGAVLQRLGFNALLGYLLAGVLLGPHATGMVQDAQAVAVLAELGVGLLLFSIGLEFSWRRLLSAGPRVLGAGALQVVTTVVIIAVVAHLAGVPGRVAVVIGAALALSSTASVLRLLSSRAALDTMYGRFSLGILLVQDVAVIPLVLLVDTLTFEGSAGAVLVHLAKTLGFAIALGGTFWVIGLKVIPRILFSRTVAGNRELALLLAALTGIGSTVAAHSVGLSPAVGAFVAGMLLAECEFAAQVRSDVGGLRTLLVTIFFVSVGMLADPAWIGTHLFTVAGLVALVVAGKAILITLLLVLLRLPLRAAVATGLCLAQSGEFAFVLAEQAYPGILDEEYLQLIAAVSVTTLFLTPALVIGAPRIAAGVASLFGASASRESGDTTRVAAHDHVVVVGLGPAGTEAVRHARQQDREVVVIDLGGGAADRARALGAEIVLGDATFPEVLEHAHVKDAAILVVAVPDPAAAALTIRLAREMAPEIRVLARARYSIFAGDLTRCGADAVVNEEEYVGRALAELLDED